MTIITWLVGGILTICTAVVLGGASEAGKRIVGTIWEKWRRQQNRSVTHREAVATEDDDWSRGQALVNTLAYVLAFTTIMVFAEFSFAVLLGPTRGAYMRLAVYGYVAVRMLNDLIWVDSIKKILGHVEGIQELQKKRRVRVKGTIAICTCMVAGMLFLNALEDLRIGKQIAREKCVSNLPGFIDKYFAARQLGKNIEELKEEEILQTMISPGLEEWREKSEWCQKRLAR